MLKSIFKVIFLLSFSIAIASDKISMNKVPMRTVSVSKLWHPRFMNNCNVLFRGNHNSRSRAICCLLCGFRAVLQQIPPK